MEDQVVVDQVAAFNWSSAARLVVLSDDAFAAEEGPLEKRLRTSLLFMAQWMIDRSCGSEM